MVGMPLLTEAPDWGDADLTALYTDVMGVSPEADKKYFCEFLFF